MHEHHNSQEEPKPISDEPSPAKDGKPRLWEQRDFWIGVGIFFGLNAIFFILSNLVNGVPSWVGIVVFVVNLSILIYAARERPNIAAGIVYSVVFLFLLGLCAGIFLIVTCFQAFNS